MEIEKVLKSKKLTPKNRKIAQFLIDNSDEIAFMSAASVANRLNISDATVIRFARSLGYDGYTDMQRSIQSDIVKMLQKPYPYQDSPGERLQKATKAEDKNVVDLVVRNSVENMETCVKKNSVALFEEASRVIVESRTVTVVGFWGNAPLAHYLFVKLGYLCDHIRLINVGAPEHFSKLFSMDERDAVLMFDTGRYGKYVTTVMNIAKRKKCKTILIADKETCPIKNDADYFIVAPNNGISFSNAVGPILVCEIFCNIVTKLRWDQREDFHADMEALLQDLDYFEDKTSSSHMIE